MFFFKYSFIFSFLMMFSSFLVLSSLNPVQSILFLILSFLFCSCLFMLTGAEFLAMLLLVVYVGAISMLFLFVVMMLNLSLFEMYFDFFNYVPMGAFMGFFFIAQLYFSLCNDWGFFLGDFLVKFDFFFSWSSFLWNKSNVFFLGLLLYNYYFVLVLFASLMLLVSMLGVMMLTVDFEYSSTVKKQMYMNSMDFSSSAFSFWKLK